MEHSQLAHIYIYIYIYIQTNMSNEYMKLQNT